MLYYHFCTNHTTLTISPGPPLFPLNPRECGSLDLAPFLTVSCLTAIWRPSSRYEPACALCLCPRAQLSHSQSLADLSPLPPTIRRWLSLSLLAMAMRSFAMLKGRGEVGIKKGINQLLEAVLFRNSCTVTEPPRQQILNSFGFVNVSWPVTSYVRVCK